MFKGVIRLQRSPRVIWLSREMYNNVNKVLGLIRLPR